MKKKKALRNKAVTFAAVYIRLFEYAFITFLLSFLFLCLKNICFIHSLTESVKLLINIIISYNTIQEQNAVTIKRQKTGYKRYFIATAIKLSNEVLDNLLSLVSWDNLILYVCLVSVSLLLGYILLLLY